MVPPPDETPKSLGDGVTGSDVEPSGPEDAQSLGDQHTFDGVAKDTSPQSLGDAQTFGGTDPDGETPFDDGMEVVDLADRYTIEGVLGKGGMGEVLLATDTRLERKVAIKRILGDGARSRTAISRFLTEAKSIAALNHPNIVQIYDYGRAADGPFLIMEFVEGNSLLDRLRDEAMPLEEAIELTCQLCDGLGMAHEANIIHRDIKPANVLLTKTGIPKLTDFGLAKDEAADTGLSVAGAVLGTLDFMPPEQRKDSALTDNRSDLWSLAATLYQMVTGESPRVIDLDGVPQQLRQTFAKALKTKKDDRYQTVREFREALQGCLAAAEPAPEVAVDLGAGECPQCHTKNEATRKFCRECAASLRVECLKCAEEIPVWDKVCAECGGKQIELADARRAELDTQREKAESLRSEYAFDESLRVAQEIGSINDSRLQHLKEWSETFIAEAETEKERQEQNAENHYAEAKTHREAFDYTSAIHAMDAIPEAMRTDDMRRYLRQLRSDHDESTELIQTISDRVKRRDLDGLLEQVNRATELRGDRNDLQKLHIQLIERREKLKRQRDEAFAAAESLLSQGQAKEALAYTKNVSTSELRASDNDLITRLQTIVKAENELTAQVTDSIAVGLDPEKVVMLLRATVAYLQMNPRHKKITGMQAQLIERIQKSPDRYVAGLAELPVDVLAKLPATVHAKLPPIRDCIAKAQGLAEECRFEAASEVLDLIPHELQTPEAIGLRDEFDTLSGLRVQAIKLLKQAIESMEYESGLQKVEGYRMTLTSEQFQADTEFRSHFQSCQLLMEEHQAANFVPPRIVDVLVNALGVDPDEVTPKTTLIGDLGAEEIDLLDIVFQLEEQFDIKIPKGRIELARTVDDLSELVAQLQ